MEEEVVLNESEASRVNYVAQTLGISSHDLRIRTCQLKSWLSERKQEAMELRATVQQLAKENFTNASTVMKLAYGVSGIIGIAFSLKMAFDITALALLLLSVFLMFVGLAELKRLLKEAWQNFSTQVDTVTG